MNSDGHFPERPNSAKLIVTDRLSIREFTEDDCDCNFMRDMLNDPDFVRNTYARNVATLEEARIYIRNNPIASYAANGHGIWLVQLEESGVAIGMCGLLKRSHLEYPDIGYAFLKQYRGMGYAIEAARAVLDYGIKHLGFPHIHAQVKADNPLSIRILEKLGMKLEGTTAGAMDGGELLLYGTP